MIDPYRQAAGQVTAEEEMIATILPMLRQLKEYYAKITDMSADWHANDMPKKIDNALATGTSLAGYSPAIYVALGALLLALEDWVKTPISLPPEILAMLNIKELTPELAFRIRWLSEAAKQQA